MNVFRKSKVRKVFALLFTLYKAKKRKVATPSSNIKAKSIHLTPKLLSIDDIVKERGSTVTEKENDRVKVFFPSDTIKRNARVQSR